MITQWRRSTVRPLSVRQAAVVEHLEEDVPDLRVRLLELVEQKDGERLLAHLRDQRRRLLLPRRVAQEALEALRGLVLAHVEAEEPVLGAEDEGAERLCDLGLARAGRADEEEDAERPRRVGQPRLHERDPVDEALDRLGLAEHARGEVLAHEVEAERRPWVEHVERQPGGVAQGRDHRLRVDRLGHASLDAVPDELEDAQDVARRRRRRQVVRCEVERFGQRVVVDLEPVAARPVARHFDRVLRDHRRQPDHLEQPRQPRPVLEQELVRAGVDLADDDRVAGLHVREQPIQ